jgi:hypothetical protein
MLRGAVGGFVLAVLLSSAPFARAAQQTLTPSSTGYWTRTQDPLITLGDQGAAVLCTLPSPEACLNPGTVTGGTPNYFRKDNYLYVATIGLNEDANGGVAVPLYSLPFGAKVTSIFLDFAVENEPAAGTFAFIPSDPNMQLCLATQGWAGQDSAPWESRPDTDCGTQSVPKLTKEETVTEESEDGVPTPIRLARFTADLMPMAKKWAAGAENNGVIIRPTPDAPPVFEAAIRPPSKPGSMAIRVTYEGGGTPAVQPPPVAAPTTENAPSFGDDVTPAAADPAPPITVDEPATDGGDEQLASPTRPVSSTSTPWWMYLGLPIGGALLFALGRGSAAPFRTAAESRAGPVSRLMDQGG